MGNSILENFSGIFQLSIYSHGNILSTGRKGNGQEPSRVGSGSHHFVFSWKENYWIFFFQLQVSKVLYLSLWQSQLSTLRIPQSHQRMDIDAGLFSKSQLDFLAVLHSLLCKPPTTCIFPCVLSLFYPLTTWFLLLLVTTFG